MTVVVPLHYANISREMTCTKWGRKTTLTCANDRKMHFVLRIQELAIVMEVGEKELSMQNVTTLDAKGSSCFLACVVMQMTVTKKSDIWRTRYVDQLRRK